MKQLGGGEQISEKGRGRKRALWGRGRGVALLWAGPCGSGAPAQKGALRWRSLETTAARRWWCFSEMKYIKPLISEIPWNYNWNYSAMSLLDRQSEGRQSGEQERYLQANNREFNSLFGYPNNSIKTSKYNALNFLPMNLFEQFQRLANAYFLILLFLQLIPQISSLAWYTTVIPLMVVLSITAVKDGVDDMKRHKNDNQVNNRSVLVLMNGRIVTDKWMNIQVGDIIKLENNQLVTADILLLSSSEPYSLTYIETAELDGETNLKVKQAISVTSDMEDNLKLLSAFDGEVRCESPNNRLDRFTGTLTYKGKNYILNHDRLIFRGCVIRNTDWCYGLVVFTGKWRKLQCSPVPSVTVVIDDNNHGPDTKVMQNGGKSAFKRTHIDHLMNVLVLWIFLFLCGMCFILAIGHYIWENKKGYYFRDFLPWKEYVSSSVVSSVLIFWSYFIILNTMVPISLYVSVEIIRLGNSFYINWDRKMFYELKNTPAQARTTTLNEELGQVKYVFSDKTGTLTRNIMTFSKCSINGKFYGDVYDKNRQKVEISEKTEKVDFSYNRLADPKFSFYDKTLVEAVKRGDRWVHLFFVSLSLCHTVIPEEKVEGELVYQAQSPDEGALVTAARNFGFVFRSRTSETIMVVEMGEIRIYKLLAILDFNNVRKRMSVIVRTPENRVMLFCKGADTILCQLLHPSCRSLRDVTMEHLDDFASDGLRTLMVAYRELDNAFFQDWSRKHSEAFLSLEDRENKISIVYEEIEKDLMLLGATAIEDKLQDGVPETIITLSQAKIKIWVLTGDKQETAVNIAYACNIFDDEMDGMFIVEGEDNETVWQELRSAREKMKPQSLLESDPIDDYLTTKPRIPFKIPEEVPSGNYGLVINGYSLAHALEGNLELELLQTACMCKGVICCRMTPLQKAQVVELVKSCPHWSRHQRSGGNAGHAQQRLRLLSVLLSSASTLGPRPLVLQSHVQVSQLLLLQKLCLHSGALLVCLLQWVLCSVYDTWFITFYNLVYTSLPVLGVSLFDQIALETTYWTMISHIFTWGSLGFYFCILFFLYSDGLCLMFPNVFQLLGVARNTLDWPQVWLSVVLSMVLCMLPVIGYHFLKPLFWPVRVDKVIDRIHHCMSHPLPPRIRTRLKHAGSRRSAYAFSHKQGFGALITSGKTLKAKFPKKNSFPFKK
ncbi:phospholipid-transporting ATPase FetA-like isoform X12 [Camelus bactrianus]|uniref:Phospholipid-transporting ATPase FetA-like isoform X12 n=1 Tax=Camelus bactrianus TaxID=9837 RepID=A0AC58Q6I2_CAMBA